MKLSIAVPWYKSKDSVFALYDRVCAAVAGISDFDQLEFVFVEDGGNDGTWEKLRELASRDQRVKAARLARNFGQHHTLTACLDLCTGDWIVVMDCDLQDRPEEIPRLYAKATEGFDMVCARRGKRGDSWAKRMSSRCFARVFSWLSGMQYDYEVANFRIFSSRVLHAYRTMREATRNLPGQLQWLGFSVGSVDVTHGSRYSGQSSYTFTKLFSLALNSIIAYSNKPLRLAIRCGILLTALSLGMSLWILIRKLFWGIPVAGWAGVMVSLWFIGGMLMGTLGIIGLYLGKIYDEVKYRPIYVLAESVNISQTTENTASGNKPTAAI